MWYNIERRWRGVKEGKITISEAMMMFVVNVQL
jgi:hypothetical protein